MSTTPRPASPAASRCSVDVASTETPTLGAEGGDHYSERAFITEVGTTKVQDYDENGAERATWVIFLLMPEQSLVSLYAESRRRSASFCAATATRAPPRPRILRQSPNPAR